MKNNNTKNQISSNDNVRRPNFNLDDYQKYEIQGFREIRAVDTAAPELLFSMHLATNKYEDIGILRGDILVIQKVDEVSKIKTNRLCICDTGKRRVAIFSDDITDEELFGVVVRIERDLEVIQ